jgi:hypothetical protein
MPPLKVVTGGLRIRSSVFAEDLDHDPILTRLLSAADQQGHSRTKGSDLGQT